MGEVLWAIFLFWLGFFVGSIDRESAILRKCQEENNVYACEIKAVPTTEPKGGNP